MFSYEKSTASIDPYGISLLGLAFIFLHIMFNAITGMGVFLDVGLLLIALRFFSFLRKGSNDDVFRWGKAKYIGKTLYGHPFHKQHGLKY